MPAPVVAEGLDEMETAAGLPGALGVLRQMSPRDRAVPAGVPYGADQMSAPAHQMQPHGRFRRARPRGRVLAGGGGQGVRQGVPQRVGDQFRDDQRDRVEVVVEIPLRERGPGEPACAPTDS